MLFNVGKLIAKLADEGLRGWNVLQSVVNWYRYIIAHNQFVCSIPQLYNPCVCETFSLHPLLSPTPVGRPTSYQADKVNKVRMSTTFQHFQHSNKTPNSVNNCFYNISLSVRYEHLRGELVIQVQQVRPFISQDTITLFHVSVAVHPTEETRSNRDLMQHNTSNAYRASQTRCVLQVQSDSYIRTYKVHSIHTFKWELHKSQ